MFASQKVRVPSWKCPFLFRRYFLHDLLFSKQKFKNATAHLLKNRSTGNPALSPSLTSSAAAVLGSWSFSTASIWRKISELMPDTFRKSPCSNTGSLLAPPPIPLPPPPRWPPCCMWPPCWWCCCCCCMPWCEGIGPGGARPGLAVRSGTDLPFSWQVERIKKQCKFFVVDFIDTNNTLPKN